METLHKCDICKKIIKDKNNEVFAGYDILPRYVFCSKCGKPVIDFLKNHKLKWRSSDL